MVNTIGGCSIQYQSVGEVPVDRSDGIEPGFPGSDANGLFDVGHEYLSVADAPGLGRAPDRIDSPLDQFIGNHDLDLHFGQKVDNVLSAPVEFGMPLLPAEPLGLGDGNALESYFLKRFLYLVELEWLDDRFNFLHRSPPRHFRVSGLQAGSHVAQAAQVFGCLARRRARELMNFPVEHNDPEPTSSKAGSVPIC